MQEVSIGSLFGQGFQNMAYALVVFVFMFIAKKWRDIATTDIDDDHEIEVKSNAAIGLRRAGLYLGIAIAMYGAISGASTGFLNDLKQLAFDGVFVLIFMMIARWICDTLMLHSVNNNVEAKKGNAAVGFLEAGSYIASGFVLNGAFSGQGGGIGSAALFFLLGQAALLILFWFYQMFTSFNVVEEISSENGGGNLAAGVAIAGMLVALGIILRASIAGDFTGWGADMLSFGVSAVIGIVALMIFRALADWLFLPNTTLAVEIARDRNVAALALTEGVIIAMAVIISASI